MPTSPRQQPRSAGRPAPAARGVPQRASQRPARRSRPAPRQSFVERNRGRLIGAGLLIVALALGGLVYLNVTAPAYACGTEWVAPPTQAPAGTPAPGTSVTIGYPQGDMGNLHAPVGTVVKYLYCPPASGQHYNSPPLGPIPARIYGPNEKALPEGWVHNLEHGALVVLYSCSGPAAGDGCSDAAQNAMKAFYSTFPTSPRCGLQPGQLGPVLARFDTMKYPYAAVVWDWILPLQSFDAGAQQQVLAFFQQHAEQNNPEDQCPNVPHAGESVPPSAAPSDVPTAAPATQPPATEPPASPAAS